MAAPLVLRGVTRSLLARFRNPREVPGKRWPVSLEGVPGAERMPDYYLTSFHAQHNGYLSELSARGYDTGVSFFFLGGDARMRRTLIRRLSYTPRRILELGCGTGTSTLLLAKKFPDATIDAVDLSPFFLARAKVRAARMFGSRVRFHQENAETLPFADGSFDLVASTFVHHEVPIAANRRIFAEAFRVLEPGKQLAICDAAQEVDTPLSRWFPKLLWEPYYGAYKRMDFEAELRTVGFQGVRIQPDFVSKTVFATRP